MTVPTPPQRTADERSRAARQAVVARQLRADVKRRVAAGYLSCSQVIDLAFTESDDGRACARMTVGDLLLSLPGVGPVTADRQLVALGINGSRRLRALGQRQRDDLRRVFW